MSKGIANSSYEFHKEVQERFKSRVLKVDMVEAIINGKRVNRVTAGKVCAWPTKFFKETYGNKRFKELMRVFKYYYDDRTQSIPRFVFGTAELNELRHFFKCLHERRVKYATVFLTREQIKDRWKLLEKSIPFLKLPDKNTSDSEALQMNKYAYKVMTFKYPVHNLNC